MELLQEIWSFLRERKKMWLLPVIISLLLLGTILFMAEGTAVAPFIYTLF